MLASLAQTAIQSAREKLGRGDIAGARQAVSSLPESAPHPDLYNLLGTLDLAEGKMPDAERHFLRSLELQPDNAATRHNLGMCLAMAGKLSEAAGALRSALAIDPHAVETWLELVSVESARHGQEAATPLLYEALGYCPERPALLHRLAQSLLLHYRFTEAMTHLRHLLRVDPAGPLGVEARVDLAQALQNLARPAEAEPLLRQALHLAPDHPRAHLNLGAALYLLRRFRLAAEHLERAVRLAPHDARAHLNRAMVHMALGESTAAVDAFRRALEIRPDYAVGHSNLLLALQYCDNVTAADIRMAAQRFGALFPMAEQPGQPKARLPGQRLRVGYVSGDFRRHVVGLFLLPLFRHHDASRFEIFCYSMVDAPDPITSQFRQMAHHWRDVRPLGDTAMANLIHEDGIDVLVDLSGHSGDNRLAVFALCPAPVQVTWLGYPGVLGLPAIPYRITDAVLDPPDEAPGTGETPIRLEGGWLCYAPPPEWGGALSVAPLPCLENGYITFGAFNNFAKMSAACLDLWAEVLKAVPGSRLISRAKPFDDPLECSRFVDAFASRGVAAGRIRALPYLPDPARHLEVYHQVDIHLDSLPYAGGTTSCDALWMGVPVVTLYGDRPAARLGASALAQLGLDHLVAHSTQEYVRIAKALAEDAGALQSLRQGLRQRFESSPLHDASGFAERMEQVYARLHQELTTGPQ